MEGNKNNKFKCLKSNLIDKIVKQFFHLPQLGKLR